MTFQALSSALDIPAVSRPGRSFLRRFVERLIDGRQHKAALEMAEYLARHPEYGDLYDEVRSPSRDR